MAPKSQDTMTSEHNRMVRPVQTVKNMRKSKFYKDPLALLGERSFKDPEEIPADVTGTPIQEFYRDATIFLTGGTGFMGKVLVEKLLRSCPHIKHVYLLIRPKKGKEVHERLDDIFSDRLFKRLKHEVPKYHHKVSAIAGDCSLPSLGISQQDRDRLIEEVNIIFHGAATVRFNEPLKQALKINVEGTRSILQLAKQVKRLKSVVHVSTAFANCPNKEIDEKFYAQPKTYEEILKSVKDCTDEEIEADLPKFIGNWPNTYTFTKATAENVVKIEGAGLPLAVFRPAVVITTYQEPIRGWIDNLYGPVGLIIGAGTGVLHTFYLNKKTVTDMVPVDLTVNSLIATAWKTGETARIQETTPIYNYVSSAQNPVSWGEFISLNQKTGILWPTVRAIWYYSFWPTNNKLLFTLATFLFHTLPGILMDFICKLTGRKPMLGKIYDRLSKVGDTLEYFATQEWKFTNYNVQNLWKEMTPEDQSIFFFDMEQMSWRYQTEALCLGLRVYMLKDDVDTLPKARKKWNRLYYAHCLLKGAVGLILCQIAVSTSLYIVRNFTS
ncbi:unnamed protein product [Bemisia tabaci]|uniref:Fatty acyl-CoA reductase n=1 Tax=Bemisia tabaci TaxID=7038 RepID=A0A9P0EZ49_BEMTA|nr:unnamed protein product [Bemisia tabaci]